MKILFGVFFLALSALASFAGEDDVTLSGFVIDDSGIPLDGILVHARSAGGQEATVVSGRTAVDGSYSLEVPDASLGWLVVTDERELLERGYFCEPGSFWPGLGGEVIDPGFFVQVPQLTTVPLWPELTLIRSEEGVSCVRLDFDWIDGISPSLLRQYRIERSLDMKTWSEVITVALGCPPMSVFDETQVEFECGYYRVVPVEPVLIAVLEPGDWQFLSDPSIGGVWIGELAFVDGEPLPETPVMAPVIFLREGE
ncbi:MAG: hypothetical protein ACI9UA_005976 [Pseudoalteromonas tetraodonis]|jgi:hypothetical protein